MKRLCEQLLNLIRPLGKVDRLILEIQRQYAEAMLLEDYHRYRSGLGAAGQAQFASRLRLLGYVVIGFATRGDGTEIAADISVVERHGEPISLRALPSQEVAIWEARAGEDVMRFSTSPDSWHHLAGRAGYALVRENVVVDLRIEVMS